MRTNPDEQPAPLPRFRGTAFVFAGGGSHGAVQVGMLEALVRAGVRPDFVVGTSVGAVNGVCFAGDPTPAGIRRLGEIWNGLSAGAIYPNLRLGWLRAFVRRRSYVVDPSGLRRVLQDAFHHEHIEDTLVPAAVVATDLRDGREVVLTRGNAIDAVLASAAIPALFPPVAHEGRMLIDGAVARNAAIASAVKLGAERVIVLPTGFSCASRSAPVGFTALGVHLVTVMLARQLFDEAEQFAARLPVIVVPPLCPLSVSSYDFSHSARLMAQAEASTAQWLDDGGLEQRAIPASLAPHVH